MRLGPLPENLIELVAVVAGMAPRPVVDSLTAVTHARTLITATKLGVFEVLARGGLGAREVAERCETSVFGTEKLLSALTGIGYVEVKEGRYALSGVTRRWLLESSPMSLRGVVLMTELVWDWVASYEEFVRTGKPLDVHAHMDSEAWALYQLGMRSLAGVLAPEMRLRTPVPKGATRMLDIGGSHGFFSVTLCRKYPALRSEVLELAAAIEHAAPLLARENMGERVVHRAGDALEDDLGEDRYDLVFISSLVHHFDEAQNRALTHRVARALRPGGAFVVQELMRPGAGDSWNSGALADLYFASTSASGTWSYEEIAGWQREAGLRPRAALQFWMIPGVGQQVAFKG